MIVDDEDFEILSEFNWAFQPNNYQSGGYAIRSLPRQRGKPRHTISMHRQILEVDDDLATDHINGNGLDNRRANLRIATTQTNAFNRGKPNVLCTSKYKGVLRRKGKNGWETRLKYNGKAIHLGVFLTEREGAMAYNYAAKLMFGEFARLNENAPEPSQNVKIMVYERCMNMVVRRNWRPVTGVFSFKMEDSR